MSLLRPRARERRQWTPEPFVSPFPGWSPFGAENGGRMSVDKALQVSAVWACVRLLADTVSMMPVHAFTLAGSARKPVPDPPMLKNPSGDATMPDWIYMLLVSALLRGNAYGRVMQWGADGYPAQIELQNPDQVQVRVDEETGQLCYKFGATDIDFRVPGKMTPQVFHLRAYRMPGSPTGLSPIQYAAKTIGIDLAVGEFAYGFFRDGAHPSSVLTTPGGVKQEDARTVKDRFMEAVRGREPAVLAGGMKYEQIQVAPNESQFLETQKYGVAAVARIFGVPPEMIAAEAGNSMTYSNVEQRAIDFLTYSIQPWLTRIESALSALLPGGRHVRFDTSTLLRTDLQTLVTANAIAIASKQMTPDEAREKLDKPPLTDEQKNILDLVPLTVNPANGSPKDVSGSDASNTINLESPDKITEVPG